MCAGVLPSSMMDIVTIVNDCAKPANASTPRDTPNNLEPASTATPACHAMDPSAIALPERSMLPMPAMTMEPRNAPAEYAPSSQPSPVESVKQHVVGEDRHKSLVKREARQVADEGEQEQREYYFVAAGESEAFSECGEYRRAASHWYPGRRLDGKG